MNKPRTTDTTTTGDNMNNHKAAITWGYKIKTEDVKPHMVADDRQVRTITMTRPRGSRVYIAAIQETLNGEYCSHAII